MKKFGLCLLLVLPGCASFHKEFPAAQLQLAHLDSQIGTYVSKPDGFSTSSYWIEGPSGLILIDTQFLPSAAEEMVNWAEKATGKKAVLAIVLHPNPDKFNGTATLQRRGIRVVTSDQVKALIPAVHRMRKEWFYDSFKPDYPEQAPVLDSFGSKTTEISAAGIKVKAHVLGAGCSEAHVAVEYQKHLFVGDLVTNDYHSWLELGLIRPWLNTLAELSRLKPQFVHPGRGPSGQAGLLEMEEAYLRKVLAIAESEKPRPLSEEKLEPILERIQAKIEAAYPGYLYPRFIENGMPSLWANLIPERAMTSPH